MAGDRQPLFPGGLRLDPGLRLVPGHATIPGQPLQLHPRRHVHDHDQVEAALEVVLRDQRDVVHDDRRVARLPLQFAHPLADPVMDDRIQFAAQRGVGEHELAQPVPVQAAVAPQHLRAELRRDLGQAGRAGGDHLPRDGIGVDDDGTV